MKSLHFRSGDSFMLKTKYFHCSLVIFAITICGNINAHSDSSIQESTQQNNYNPSERSNKQADKNENRSESLKAIPVELIAQAQDKETKADRKQDHKWYETFYNHITDWLLAIFSGLLVLFTFRLWKATVGLWEVSQEQSKHMEASIAVAKETADAAQKSAYAATKTISTLESQERAYLFVEEINLLQEDNLYIGTSYNSPEDIIKIGTMESPGENHAQLTIINHGKTPAVLTGIYMVIDLFDNASSVAEYFGNILQPTNPTIAHGTEVIISGKKGFHNSDFLMSTNLWQYVITSESDLLCVGCIKYEDIFGKPHNTVFCWKYEELKNDFSPYNKYRFNYIT